MNTKLHNRILLTGSSGFLGKNIVQLLGEEKADQCLIKIDKEASDSTTIRLDLAEANPLEFLSVTTPIKATIHLAAESCVYVPEDKQEAIIKHNLACFENAVKITAKLGGELFIHASSRAVYGAANHTRYSEDFECQPLGAYGASKLACEKASLQLEEDYGIKIVNLRLHNLIGFNQKTSMLPHLIYENIFKQRPLELFGITHRSWTPAEQLVSFLIALCNKVNDKLFIRNLKNVYNYGSKTAVSQLDLIDIAEKITGIPCKYKVVHSRSFEMLKTLPDMTLFESQFGAAFVPQNSQFLFQSMENVLKTFK
jgi:nucleoside-diphosphate-sugar epimerase